MPARPSPQPYATVGNVRLFHGDCREIVPRLGRQYELVFGDPPFNIGQNYQDYVDRMTPADYALFTSQWLRVAWEVCAPTGVLALHGADYQAELYLGKMVTERRVAWIVWHYRFGQCNRSNWINGHAHCLVYAKGKTHTWNPEAVLVNSDRAEVYGDKRVHETERGGQRVPFSVWGIPSDGPNFGRVQGNNQERCEHSPNQLPEMYLARLLKAYTLPHASPGPTVPKTTVPGMGSVLDCFGGAGTVGVVAAALGRHCDVIEKSERSCAEIVKRLKRGAVRL